MLTMAKKAKTRKPGEPILATFLIADEVWQQFQAKAQSEGKTAANVLMAFVENYLVHSAPESQPTEALAAQIESTIDRKMAEVENVLDQLQNHLSDLDCRLERIEKTLTSTNPSTPQNPSQIIDIDAIAVEFLTPDSPTPRDSALTPPEIGITEKALCEEFGINPFNVHRNAQVRGISRQAYLHQLTGWFYRNGLYYSV